LSRAATFKALAPAFCSIWRDFRRASFAAFSCSNAAWVFCRRRGFGQVVALEQGRTDGPLVAEAFSDGQPVGEAVLPVTPAFTTACLVCFDQP
jgi:hypothetical protein